MRSLTDMNQAFQNCTSLTKLNVSGWDVSKVTNMTLAFAEDRALSSLDLSTWDNSAVTSMKDVFSMMDSLSEVSLGSKFKFVGTSPFLPDQTGHVAGADGKWYDTDGNGYAPADVPSNKAMTYYASKDLVPGITISGNAEVGETLTATVNNLSEEEITGYQWYTVDNSSNETAIANATAHTYTVTANEVGKKILCKAFYKNGSATKNVKTTPTDNVTPQKTAFAVYSADDNSLDFYKRTEVPTAGSTFEGKTATAVYTGIETKTYNWNTQPWRASRDNITTATVVDDGIRPKSTAYWFYCCMNMTSCDLSKLDITKVTDASSMFDFCSSITTLGDLSGWDVSKMTKMGSMFSGCSSITTLGDLSGWDVSKVTDASSMFSGCSSITTLGDLSGWDVSKMTKMGSMFKGCSSITTLGDLSGWDVSSLTTASFMFNGCSSITTLGDLSGWDVSSLTDASYMFDFCPSLTTLGDLSGWDVSSLKYAHYMFTSCSNLILDCSKWDVYKVRGHNGFNTNAPGVILPLAWQASSDEGGEDSAIAPLCEEQENRDALSVPSENGNDEAVSKTDGEASADSETEGSNTASADDAGAKEEEASDGSVQEKPAAA